MVAAEEQIMDAYPGSDSYAETLARLAKLMDDEKIHQDHIAQMSEASARVFLDQFVQMAAKMLGLTAAKVAALVSDLMQIGRNAGAAFKETFKKNYEQQRRIKPYGST
jgi:hypothetical protein